MWREPVCITKSQAILTVNGYSIPKLFSRMYQPLKLRRYPFQVLNLRLEVFNGVAFLAVNNKRVSVGDLDIKEDRM